MSLSKLFQRIIFHNNTTPAINEDNLNAMSKAIDDIDDRVILIGDDVVTVIPQIRAYLEQAEDLAEVMEQLSKNPPYIGSNGNWYVWDTNTEDFVDSGIDASITVSIADINLLPVGSTPYVTNTGTSTDPIFHLYIPQAKSITNVVKDGGFDDPLIDKYDVIFNDNTRTSFYVTNGVGIVSITKESTQGLVDTYTISCSDGTGYDFTVTNGATGNGIASITKTGTQGLVDTYTITMTDGTTSTFTVTNGESGSADKMDKVNPSGTGTLSLNRNGSSTIGNYSVAIGRNSIASGEGSVSVGTSSEATSYYTFAGGFQGKATNSGAFAYGIGVTSNGRGKAVFGVYNDAKSNTVFEIGNGTGDSGRSNIFEIYNDGKISTDNGNTKHDLTALGDMLESTYDSDSTVKNAGGIADYVAAHISDINTALGNEVATRTKVSGHNLLPNLLRNRTYAGITYTRNKDGSVTLDGTSTGYSYTRLFDTALGDSPVILKKGAYILSGKCGDYATNQVSIAVVIENTPYTAFGNDEVTITLDTDSVMTYATYQLGEGKTLNNLVCYPMLRLATDESSDYEPYAMTNQQMTPYVQAISNPNLLDNPWFTVNQRGITSFTDVGSGFSVDRWYHDSNATGSISNGVYTCNVPTYQQWEDDRITPFLGKVVTLSWLLSDGTIGSETKTLPSTLTSSFVWPFTNSYVVMALRNSNTSQVARINPNISIKAVKLELGSVSTLANDTLPNYGSELLKCQTAVDSSDAYANRNISGAELVLEQSQTLSTSADTVYTFTNAAITANSAVDVWTDIRGITPSNHVTTNGQSVVTFPKQATAQTMTCRIYVK